MMMTKRLLVTLGTVAAMVSLGLGCSTDSPTAPVQNPGTPPGTGPPSATWIIEVTVSPAELSVNSDQPTTIGIRVRRADNGLAPVSGTTLVASTSLGDFESPGSGQQSVALTTVGGQASTFLYAGSVSGTALISAQLEASVGQRTVFFREEIEEVEAVFSFQNSENNLSVQFLDQSNGEPTEWLWNFGDGGTSTEQHPHHIFPAIGDYPVTLTASKVGSSDSTSQLVVVGQFIELQADFSFQNSEGNNSVTFINTSLGDPTSFLWDFGDGRTSSEENPDHIYPFPGDYVVTLTVRRGPETSTISKIVVVGQPLDLFVNFISPTTGVDTGGTTVTINGTGFAEPLAVLFGTKFGDVTSVTGTEIRVRTPPGDLVVEECDSDDDGTVDGTRILDTTVSITIELETGPTVTLPSAFTYLSPTGGACL